jgi:hypothetical protein
MICSRLDQYNGHDMEKQIMRTNEIQLETFMVRFAWGFASTILLMLMLLALLIVAGLTDTSFAEDAQPRKFASAGEAASALVEAAKTANEQALEAILGAGKEVTSSSDGEEDKLEREQFSEKYQQMHRLVREPDGSTVLYIGAENWPFPVPLVSKNGEWSFDASRGKQEILFRRIGENEATAAEVCEQFALARNEAGSDLPSEDSITKFVQSLISSAAANAGSKEPIAFHGYYFRIVTTASSSGAGSLSNAKAASTLIAYPAEYKSSGVMTFVLNGDGIVYEKNLGPSTPTVAPQIKGASGSGWHPEEKS